MKKPVSLFLCLIVIALEICSFASCGNIAEEKFTEYCFDYFDTATTIIGYEKNRKDFDEVCADIKNQLGEYHRLYTIYNSYDGINNLCSLNKIKNGKHEKLTVDKKIIDLLAFCKDVYIRTDGRVNIAMGSVLSVWHQYRESGVNNPEEAKLPPFEKLKEAQKHTDINDIIIDRENNTVFLADADMTIDVGAVAKGYAVEKTGEYLKKKGVTGYLLNVGGNVKGVCGENEKGFEVGIENPVDGDSFLKQINVTNECVVTSGDYQRFYTVDGKNYHHIIDPETLMPGENFKSVSVIAKDSALADAYSTALFLMTYEQGKNFLADKTDVKVIWVLQDGNILEK